MIADSVRKLAGQALVAGFPAGEPPAELLAAAGRGELGGFILFRRNLGPPAAVVELTRRLADSLPGRPAALDRGRPGGRPRAAARIAGAAAAADARPGQRRPARP